MMALVCFDDLGVTRAAAFVCDGEVAMIFDRIQYTEDASTRPTLKIDSKAISLQIFCLGWIE